MKNEHGFSIWENTGSMRRAVDVYWFGWKTGVSNSGNDDKRIYR